MQLTHLLCVITTGQLITQFRKESSKAREGENAFSPEHRKHISHQPFRKPDVYLICTNSKPISQHITKSLGNFNSLLMMNLDEVDFKSKIHSWDSRL